MHACRRWGAVAALFLFWNGLSTAVAREEAVSPEAGAWAETLHGMASDEIYRRDGVITTMQTCLLVASDDHAYGLWNANADWHERSAPDLSTLLYQLPMAAKQQRGFGTVLACAQILKTWHTDLRTRSQSRPTFSVDGRVEHGAVVIDLGLGPEGRAAIEPLPLVRLLTSPNLLPKWAFGGIVVRRATITDTLLLHNLHLSIPLVFADVRFIGGGYRKDVYEIDGAVKKTAISIVHSRFSDYLMISASEICGSVRITDSHFGDKIEWRGVRQKPLVSTSVDPSGLQCADGVVQEPIPGFHVYSSQFTQSLRINKSNLGSFYAAGNSIARLDASATEFGATFSFVDNDVGSMVFFSHLAEKNSINYNRIKNDFFISGQVLVDDKPAVVDSRISSLSINSNRVGGGIGLLNFPAGRLPKAISLESNHVGNGSMVCLPERWAGSVSLDGSSYDGKLVIGLTELDVPKKIDNSDSLQCSIGFRYPVRFDEGENTYCSDISELSYAELEKIVQINLEAADIRTLGWQLPLQCDFRWKGFGLKYRLWQPHDDAALILSERTGDWDLSTLRVFRAWRTTLWNHEPAPLDRMSRYLTENGAYNESRALLLEAKRLNYVPVCSPDRWLLVCAYIMTKKAIENVVAGVVSRRSQIITTADAASNDDGEQAGSFSPMVMAESGLVMVGDGFNSVWSWLTSLLMLFLLWPGGYGAQPERAIIVMALAMPSFWMAYRYYSYRLIHELANVPDLIEPLRDKAFAADLISRWPKRDSWMLDINVAGRPNSLSGFLLSTLDRWRSMGRRYTEPAENVWLEQVQGPLMDVVKESEKGLVENERAQIASLRHRLERLGNTDVLGFSRFDGNKMPTRFTRWLYSVDTMLPVIDLHAYSNYYPVSFRMRFTSVVQHIIGWWLVTVFIASAAIL